MGRTGPNLSLGVAVLMALTVLGCSTVSQVTSGPGASSEQEAASMRPDDPLARPVQVAWTSARATYCGFIFNPEQLRANYLAAEARTGVSPTQMQKIQEAYDYTRQATLDTIKDNAHYCNKERTTAIRADLNRYLAGDYRPTARMGR